MHENVLLVIKNVFLPQLRLLFNRSAHSAVPIWMLGCLDALRIGGGIGRIGRIGESGGFGESGGLEGLVGLGGLVGLRGLGGFGSGRAFWYPKAPRNHRPDTKWTNF